MDYSWVNYHVTERVACIPKWVRGQCRAQWEWAGKPLTWGEALIKVTNDHQ